GCRHLSMLLTGPSLCTSEQTAVFPAAIFVSMTLIRTYRLATRVAALLALSGIVALAQDGGQRGDRNNDRNRTTTQFTSHDQQVTHDWYNQHKDNPPAGFRTEDRLSPEQESHLQEGAVLDRDMRRHVHPAPPELT